MICLRKKIKPICQLEKFFAAIDSDKNFVLDFANC